MVSSLVKFGIETLKGNSRLAFLKLDADHWLVKIAKAVQDKSENRIFEGDG